MVNPQVSTLKFWLLVLITISTSSVADEKTKQLAQTQAQIKQLENRIQLSKQQELALIRQLATIEIKSGKLAQTLATLAKQIKQQQQLLAELSKRIKTQQLQVREQSQGLVSQIKSAYVMGRQDRLKLLLNQQDPSRSTRLLSYYDYFNEARLTRRKLLNQSLTILLESQQKQTVAEQRLTSLLAETRLEQQTLISASTERELVLEQLTSDLKSKNTELTQLRDNELALKKILRQRHKRHKTLTAKTIDEQAFKPLKGHLNWPVAGKLQQRFGSRRANRRWDGVLITAKEGQAVKAVSSGRVIFADWFRGYGLLIIIDHGDDYMTLYAFAQSLEKVTGDQVRAGEVIAAVGKTDGRRQAGLYFGLRKKGKAVDPAPWCKKVSNGRTS